MQESVAQGAAILLGGVADADMNRGGATFYPPTILLNMTEEMTPFREETFGPVAPLMKFKTEDEAIAIANNTKYEESPSFCDAILIRHHNLSFHPFFSS